MAKKLTLKQVQAVLQQMGVDLAEIVNDDTAAEQNFDADGVVNQFLNAKEPIFHSRYNETVLPGRLQQHAGEIGGKLRTKIRQLSGNKLKSSDLDGLSDEDALGKLVELLQTTGNENVQDLRTQLQNIIAEHNAATETLKGTHAQELAAMTAKFNETGIDGYFQTLVKASPLLPVREGEDATKTLQKRANALKAALRAEYGEFWNPEKGELELRDKTKTENPVILEGNKILTPKDFAESYFKDLGIWQTDTRNQDAHQQQQQFQQQQQQGGAGQYNGGWQQQQQGGGQQQMGQQMPADLASAISKINGA